MEYQAVLFHKTFRRSDSGETAFSAAYRAIPDFSHTSLPFGCGCFPCSRYVGCKYKKKTLKRVSSFMLALPIFPGRLQPSIVGRSELNFRVRDGNGWTLALISTNCCIATVLYSNKPLSNCQVVPSGTFKRFAQQNLAAGRIHFARGFFVLKGSRKSIAFLGW